MIRAGGVIAAALGFLALVGWWTGAHALATFGADRIPMAPSTALVFVVFGVALILHADAGQEDRPGRLVQAMGAGGTLIAIVLLVLSSIGVAWHAEHLGMRIEGSVGGAPVGHMSPVTALAFVLVGSALLLQLRGAGGGATRRASFAVTLALLFLALMLTVAYLLGGPLLYDTGTIPPALTTSLGFVALGTGLLAGLAPHGVARVGGTTLRLILVTVVGVAVITAPAYLLFRDYQQRFRAAVEGELAGIADLKVGQILAWRSERAADAMVVARHEAFVRLTQQLLRESEDGPAASRIRTWLEPTLVEYRYDRISVVDAAGTERVATPGAVEVHPELAEPVARVLGSGEAVFTDLHRDAPDGSIEMAVLAPIRASDREEPAGVVALWVDPSVYLYPVLQGWPTPSRTAETLLVRRDGNDVLFLNDLRFHDDAALRLRIPLARTELPAAMAVEGVEGVVEGTDYRGERVVAAVRQVPGSAWFLVARQDAAEVLAPVRQRLRWTLGLISALLLGMGAMVAVVWQREEKAHFRSLALAQAGLRESELRHRITLRSIGDAVIATDAAGRIELMNPVAWEMTGWTEEEAHGKPLHEVFHIINEQTRRPVESPVERVMREGHLVGLANHTVLIARDGTERPIVDSGAPIRDQAGVTTGVVLVFRDQTEERAADQRLRDQVERSQRYLDVAGVMIVTLDRDGNVELINERGCGILGYPEEEVVGKNWFDHFVPEEDRDRVRSVFTRAMAGDLESAAIVENPVVTRTGEERLIAWKNAVIRDGDGQVNGSISSGEDITERRAAEEALRQSEARYRHLFEAMEQGVVYQDADGAITSANPAAERILGLSLDQLQGRTSMHPDWRVMREDGSDFPGEERPAMLALATGRPVTGVVMGVYHPETDETRWILVDAVPERLPGASAPYQVFATFTDVTERKRAEEKEARLQDQLLQVQKMESVGRLAGGVAHDFNNMLAVILGHAELALEDLEEGDPLRGEIQAIRSAAQRSADLTRQLLAFARKQTMAPRVLDLNQTVEGMLSMLRRLIGEDIELVWRPAADTWPTHIDPAQIDQLLANLVVNARDAIGGHGRITIETRNVDLDHDYAEAHPDFVPGAYVMLAVSDDGRGMEPKVLDRIFDPFYTTKAPGEGTGLGLATVYGIVKQNEGFIHVYSEPGDGTTFRIYLPRVHGMADQAGPAHAEPPLGGTETILVVEDEGAVMDLGRRILEGFGYTVLTASTPAQALRIAEEHNGSIDLLLTDVVMPGMNGRELAERLQEGAAGLRTLFMSGYTADVIAHKGVLDMGVHFIQKPFSRELLGTAVRQVLDQDDDR